MTEGENMGAKKALLFVAVVFFVAGTFVAAPFGLSPVAAGLACLAGSFLL